MARCHHECKCKPRNVTAYFRRTRHESLPFLSHPMSRITKSFVRLMIRFQEFISIIEVARNFGVDWRCVKDAETGRVLSVTRGKGIVAIKQFTWRLKKYKGKIKYVCIDMPQAY